jgi:hypothetical protein
MVSKAAGSSPDTVNFVSVPLAQDESRSVAIPAPIIKLLKFLIKRFLS